MRLDIQGLADLRARLQAAHPAETAARTLAEEADRLAQIVRDSLSQPQGAGAHDKPWVRTGALRDSIAVSADGLEAAIGSNDKAAAPQEMGTVRIPPRPYLAPAAAAQGEIIANAIGASVATTLRGETVNNS